MLSGACLCGAVQYTVSEAISEIQCCHCLTCRKAHSSAFSMGVTIAADAFKLTAGEQNLAEFESSEGKFRVFCKQCGSHLYAYKPSQAEFLRLRPACLNTDLGVFKVRHIHTESQIPL